MFSKLIYSNKPYILITLIAIFSVHLLYQNAQDRMGTVLTKYNGAQISGDVSVVAVEFPISVVQQSNQDTEEPILVAQTVPGEIFPQAQEIPYDDVSPIFNDDQNEEELVSEDISTTTEEVFVLSLPYQSDSFFFGDEWVSGFGSYSYQNDNLVIGGNLGHTASLVYLNGTDDLSNYSFNTVLDWNRGSSVSIVARMQDFNNYVACSFFNSGKYASIVHVVDGERSESGNSPELPLPVIDPWKNLELGIEVDGDSVRCISDGNVVLRQNISNLFDTGRAGISIWSAIEGEALITVQEVMLNETN